MANLANKGPVAEEPIEEEDGVKVALQNLPCALSPLKPEEMAWSWVQQR